MKLVNSSAHYETLCSVQAVSPLRGLDSNPIGQPGFSSLTLVNISSLLFTNPAPNLPSFITYHNLFPLRATLRRGIPDTIVLILIFRHVWSTSRRKTRTEKLQRHFRSGHWGRGDSASNRRAPG